MKITTIALVIFFVCRLNVNAQRHIDTVHVEGYHIANMLKFEQQPAPVRRVNDSTVEISQRIDGHLDFLFVPLDSISDKRDLSYWLNHYFDYTNKVFISCEKRGSDTCLFPHMETGTFYETTNINSEDVFKIYYLDADWVRIPVKVESLEAH